MSVNLPEQNNEGTSTPRQTFGARKKHKRKISPAKKVAIAVVATLATAAAVSLPIVAIKNVKYEVSINYGIAGKSESLKVKKGSKISEIVSPQKEGLFFAGYYSDANLTKPLDADKEITEDTTIYLNYIPIKYSFSNIPSNVSIKGQDGNITIASILSYNQQIEVSYKVQAHNHITKFEIVGAQQVGQTTTKTEGDATIYTANFVVKGTGYATSADVELTPKFSQDIDFYNAIFINGNTQFTKQTPTHTGSLANMATPQKTPTLVEEYVFMGWTLNGSYVEYNPANSSSIITDLHSFNVQNYAVENELKNEDEIKFYAVYKSQPRRYYINQNSTGATIKTYKYNTVLWQEFESSLPVNYGDTVKIEFAPNYGLTINSLNVVGLDITQTDNETYVIGTVKGDVYLSYTTTQIEYTKGLDFKQVEGGYSVKSYSGKSANVFIPKTYNGQPVVEIESDAFTNNKTITSVSIPASVKTIKQSLYSEGAFTSCSNLVSVNFETGSQLTSIGNHTFKYCTSLTSITIPASVKSIGSYAFQVCSKLENVYFEQNSQLTSISNHAFNACGKMSNFEMPSTITSIGSYAFSGCNSLQFYDYDNALYLGNSTNNYVALIKIKNAEYTTCIINKNTKVMQDNVFAYNENLTSVSFESGCEITNISANAFSGCANLSSIVIPASVINIGVSAFIDCSELESVAFGANSQLTNIQNSAFSSCGKLTSITIPASVENIEQLAFYGCYNLTEVAFEQNSKLISLGNNVFNSCSNLDNVIIPASVKNIGNYAFYNCSELKHITFEEDSQLENMGNNMFNRCNGLKSIIIPAGVSTLPNNTFDNCSSLISVSFAEGSVLTYIAEKAFIDCSQLENVEIPFGVVGIGNGAFWACCGLLSIEIPASVKNIGDYAFYRSSNLQTLTFAQNSQLTQIGSYAFCECYCLEDIELPTTLLSIGCSAFSSCFSLQNLKIPVAVETIGEDAFKNCNYNNVVIDSYSIYSAITGSGEDVVGGIINRVSQIYILASVDDGSNTFFSSENFRIYTDGDYNLYIKN